MFEKSTQHLLPEQEIQVDSQESFVLLGAEGTYGYLRRKIEPDFILHPDWIRFEPID